MKKTRVSKSWSKHNLSDDIWPEILVRLPVKSLLRFRCVSRSWRAWIDHPDFTRSHLHRFNNHPHSETLFVQGYHFDCVLKNSETLTTISTLGFLQSHPESLHVLRSTRPSASASAALTTWSIVSSIDGLFLLRCEDQPCLMLWNPSIRKTLPLPPVPQISQFDENPLTIDFGVGFDPFLRVYKVVKFISLPTYRLLFAAVYTLGTYSWKLFDFRGEGLSFRLVKSTISFNGVLYGIARDFQSYLMKLVSLDLRNDVLASSDLPVTPQAISKYSLTTVDDGSSLALVQVWPLYGSIWVMERLGDGTEAGSWIQRYTFDTVSRDDFYDCYHFLCIKKNGEMLIKWHNNVICYNFETGQRKMKHRKNFEVGTMVTYMESLILHA